MAKILPFPELEGAKPEHCPVQPVFPVSAHTHV